MASEEVTRDQWAKETEKLCPSTQAFTAYEQLEQMVTEETQINCGYQRVQRGQNAYCTFSGKHAGMDIIQVYKGICQLNWRCKPKIPGITEEQHEELNQAFEDFRTSLGGKEGKGWETIKVLRHGTETVEDVIRKLSESIDGVLSSVAEAQEA